MGIHASVGEYYGAAKTYAAGFLSNPSWDIMLVIAFLSVSFFTGVMMGKRRIISSILYTYISFALYSVIPQERVLAWLSFLDPFAARIIVFLAIFITLYLLLGSRGSRSPVRASAWWQVVLLSFVQVGFLFHIVIGFLPKETVDTLAPVTRAVFANASLKIWWFIVPVVLLVLFRRWGRDGGD